jgi:PAS domain S-box-containing protein
MSEGTRVTGTTDTRERRQPAMASEVAAPPYPRSAGLDATALKEMLDASPAGILHTDSDGQLIYSGGALFRRAGLAGPGPWHERWNSFIHPEDLARVTLACETATAERAPLRIEYRLHPAEGADRWVLTCAEPRFDEADRFVGHVATTTETSDQKRTQERLRDGEELYRSVIAGLDDGIVLVDPAGTILECNPRAAEILGMPADQLEGRTLDRLERLLFDETGAPLPPEQHPAMIALRTGRPCTNRVVLIERYDRTRLWVRTSHQPLTRPGARSPHGVVISLVDITDRRDTEAALRRAKEQAEAASRTKSAFLANMSHELRTPLNAIIGFAEIMRDELLGPLGAPHYRDYAADIFQSGRHLLDLINDILDLSKVEAGRLELHDEDCDLPAILASSLRLMNERAHANDLRIEQRFPPRLPLLRADVRSLKQILLNLVSNAIKFTPAEGRIIISAVADADSFRFAVKDTGIGMTPDGVKKALEAFGQVDSSLSRKYEGTGLGLPLTRALIELHGGRLEIESALGEGTCVTAIFPADRIIRELPPV